MVLDLMPWLAIRPAPDRCVCNRPIFDEPYYGQQSVEAEEIVFFDATHDGCLREWGWRLDPAAPLGITHVHVEESDEDIRGH